MTRRQRPTDPTGRALLDAILAAPDDDARRLVYADRLIERGDPQGELTVVQCERARLERALDVATPAYHALRRREKELLVVLAEHWEKSFGFGYAPSRVERGFIVHAAVPFHDLRLRWRLFSAHPLEEIHVTSARYDDGPSLGDLAWLARKPTVRRARGLAVDLAGVRLDLDPLRACDALREYRRDDPTPAVHTIGGPPLRDAIRGVSIDTLDEHLRANLIDDSPPNLVAFGIDAGQLTSDVILNAPALPALRRLEILRATADFAAAVLGATTLASLDELVITTATDGTRFTLDIGAALAASPLLPQLTALRAEVAVDLELANALALRARRLERLVLDRVITADPLAVLMRAPFVPQLRRLELGALEDIPSLFDVAAAAFTRLESLVLHGFESVDEKQAAALASSACLATVHDLRFLRIQVPPSVSAVLHDRWPYLSFGW